jgi:thiamine kinase-like enzyme
MAEHLSRLVAPYGEPEIQHCERLRTKYRVGTSLRVLYEVRGSTKSYRIAARATESNTMFWVFPHDRKIKNLSVLEQIPHELHDIGGQHWTRSRIVGHAPEKSLTAQCLSDNNKVLAYAKIYAGDEGQQVFNIYLDVAQALMQSAGDLQIPQALSYSDKHHLLLLESVPGISSATEVSFFRLGKALKALHSIKTPSSLPHCARFTPEAFAQTAETLTQARPDVASQVQQLAGQLITSGEHSGTGEPVFLHGDVHPKNILLDGERLFLLDLDQAAAGVATVDLGSVIAGLYCNSCTGSLTWREAASLKRALLNGYGPITSSKALRRHVAAALFQERALRSVSRVRINSLRKLPEILSTAETVLNGGISEN